MREMMDITPKWTAIMPLLIEGASNISGEGREACIDNLFKLADTGDKLMAVQKAGHGPCDEMPGLNVRELPAFIQTETGEIDNRSATASQWRWAAVHDDRCELFTKDIDFVVLLANALRVPDNTPLLPALDMCTAFVRKFCAE